MAQPATMKGARMTIQSKRDLVFHDRYGTSTVKKAPTTYGGTVRSCTSTTLMSGYSARTSVWCAVAMSSASAVGSERAHRGEECDALDRDVVEHEDEAVPQLLSIATSVGYARRTQR